MDVRRSNKQSAVKLTIRWAADAAVVTRGAAIQAGTRAAATRVDIPADIRGVVRRIPAAATVPVETGETTK